MSKLGDSAEVRIEALKGKIFNFNENKENHRVYPSACGMWIKSIKIIFQKTIDGEANFIGILNKVICFKLTAVQLQIQICVMIYIDMGLRYN